MSGGGTEWKYVQNGNRVGNTGGERPPKDSRTAYSQQPKPQRQPREGNEGGGGGGRRDRDRERERGVPQQHGQQQSQQNQGYQQGQQQYGYQNGFRPAKPPPGEYPTKPAIDGESIASIMKEGKSDVIQSTLLELVNQRSELDQFIVTLSDQVVQKGSQYLSLQAKLKATNEELAAAKAEREQTVSDLNAQLQAKQSEAVEILNKLKSAKHRLENTRHENQVRDRELMGARKQLEEAVRKLTVSEEGLKAKKEQLKKAQDELNTEKGRVDEIDSHTLSLEEQVSQLKVNLGHKDFQNYQMVDKIRGMELHFQNQYSCWNKDRQNLEQQLHRLKGLTSDLLHFNGNAGDAGKSAGGFVPPPPTMKLLSEEELLSMLAVIVGEGRANAKPWTSTEEQMFDSLLQPFKWMENYAPKYGSMVDFIRKHSNIFKEREEDGWMYRVEGAIALPPLPPGLLPGALPPLPPPGFQVSNGGQSSMMMPMLNNFGDGVPNGGLMDDMKNPMMQFMMPNQNMHLPPMLVTPLAPQKNPQKGQIQGQVQVEGLMNGAQQGAIGNRKNG